MDYTGIKSAMAAAGHPASEGPEWTPKDAELFRAFAHFQLGVNHEQAHHVIQFPEHYEAQARTYVANMGHPSAAPIDPPHNEIEADKVDSENTAPPAPEPVAPPPAPEPPPVPPAPEPVVEAPPAPLVEEPPVEEPPAEEPPAEDKLAEDKGPAAPVDDEI